MTGVVSKTAREIASEWHGGQFSELYKFSSSGLCDSVNLLHQEVNGCFQDLALFPEEERISLTLELQYLRETFLETFDAPENPAEDGHA